MQYLISFFTTENELFCNILTLLLGFIEMSLLISFISTLYNLSIPKRIFFLTAFLLTSFGTLCRLFCPLPFSLIFNIIIHISIVFFLLKVSLFKAIIADLTFVCFIALLEYIINLFITKVFCFDIYPSTLIPIYKIIFSLLSYLFTFIVIYFIKHIKTNFNFLDEFNKKEKFNILIFIVSTILLICPNLVFLILVNMKIPTFYIIYNIICSIIFFFLGTYSTYKVNKLQITQRELQTANLYNSTLSKLVDSNRAFRHDINNIVNSIGGFIELNDMNGLKKYYNSGLLPDIQKSNNLSLLNPDVINSPPLFGLFLAKYNYADTLGVKIELNSFFDYSTINMNIFDFVKIFGILLDNAIEAASKCDNKLVSIYITIDFYNRKQVFKINNSYLNKDIDINKIFDKDFSTKEIKSGFGLWEVKQLLKKYPKVKLLSSKDDSFFSQKLELYF